LSPIGAIIAWAKTMASVPQTLPVGWVECDGSTISDAESPMNGEDVPDLNGGEFLRGAATSGGTGGTTSHTHTTAFNRDGNQGGIGLLGSDHTPVTSTGPLPSHLPPYYDVVWIMRIK
jgi:hypothetical protein